jgi:hypothetical protein
MRLQNRKAGRHVRRILENTTKCYKILATLPTLPVILTVLMGCNSKRKEFRLASNSRSARLVPAKLCGGSTTANPENLRVRYPSDDGHFVVDTNLGAIRIIEIVFTIERTEKEIEVPLLRVQISQSAAFVFECLNTRLSLEMHKLTGSSGETTVVLRNLGKR